MEKYLKEDIQIFMEDKWITYDKAMAVVGGYWYSSDLRFVDKDGNVYKEVGTKKYESVAYPFYYGSDMTKSYAEVFKNSKILNERYPFYIYDDYLDYLIKKI